MFTRNNDRPSNMIIGTQTWAITNLDVSTFRNGDIIPETKTDVEWKKAGDEGKPVWCYYENDPANGKKYGKLYNWFAVDDYRGLAPDGWHVPTNTEWITLINYLGGPKVAGTKMKSNIGWNDCAGKSGNGTNISGFAGPPVGCRNEDGPFNSIGDSGNWWSSTEGLADDAGICDLNYNNGDVNRVDGAKEAGFSVRCLRD